MSNPRTRRRAMATASCVYVVLFCLPALPSALPAQPVLTGITFAQLDWFDQSGSLVQADSLYGQLSWTYDPDPTTTYYLNVNLSLTSGGPGTWAVQNLPLFGVDNGDFSTRTEGTYFNLAELGVSPGTNVAQIFYDMTVTATAQGAPPGPAVTMAPVVDLTRRASDDIAESPHPGPFTDPGEPEGVKVAAAPVKVNKARDVREVQEGTAKCCAGAFARSLDWLNREHGLGSNKNAQQMYDDLIAAGVSAPGQGGPNSRDEWIEYKNTYAKGISNKIVTKVWESAATTVDDTDGVTQTTGDFATWLKGEIETEDVELAYFYPGNAHIVTILEVYEKDGETWCKYRDDEAQGDNTKGDGKGGNEFSAVKHAKIYQKNGQYHFGSDANTIYFAVSESVVNDVWAVDNLGEFNGGTIGDRVITFDVSNPGTVTVIGATGVAATLMGGMDFGPGGTLYCYAQVTGGALYTVNQGNGVATLVGSGGAGGDTISDITYSAADGKMYGIGLNRGGTVNLYNINLNTGVASVDAAITDPTGTMLNIGLANDPTTNDLYVLDLVTDFVFRRVGSAWVALPNPVGFNANFSQGMNCNAGGTLYLGALNNDSFRTELRSVNTATGTSTFLGFIGGVNPNGLPEYETGDIAFEPSAGCGTEYCDTNANNVADIAVSGCDCSAGSIVVSMSNSPSPDGNNGYLLIGASNSVSTDPPGAIGDLCLIGSSIGRYIADVQAISGGGISTDILNALSGGGGGNIPNPPGGNVCSPSGQTWNFQYWHRDGMNPSRFSKAIAVTFN